jgi:hypothetical protein
MGRLESNARILQTRSNSDECPKIIKQKTKKLKKKRTP